MAKMHNKLWEDPWTASSSEEMVVISSGEEEEDEEQHTIFSSSEDKPDKPPNPVSRKAIAVNEKKEVRGYGAVESGKKQPSEETSTDVNAKRAKKVSAEDEKKIKVDRKNSKRVFTEEDEILVLQGIIDFKTDSWKADGFYESVKKSVSFEMYEQQFRDKIWNLKKKYMAKMKNGVESYFSNPHDKLCFELSNRIWGRKGKKKKPDLLKQVLLSPPKGKKDEGDSSKVLIHGGDLESPKSDWFEKSFLVQSIGLDEHLVKQRWSKVSMETKKKTEEKLKLLQAKEIECALQKRNLELQKINLLREVTSVIGEAD